MIIIMPPSSTPSLQECTQTFFKIMTSQFSDYDKIQHLLLLWTITFFHYDKITQQIVQAVQKLESNSESSSEHEQLQLDLHQSNVIQFPKI